MLDLFACAKIIFKNSQAVRDVPEDGGDLGELASGEKPVLRIIGLQERNKNDNS